MQLNAKKHIVYGAIAFIWIVIPTVQIVFTSLITDIIQGTCWAFGAYKSYAIKKTIGFFALFVAYILPLALLVFCYSRIIHALRTKVTLFSGESRNCQMGADHGEPVTGSGIGRFSPQQGSKAELL